MNVTRDSDDLCGATDEFADGSRTPQIGVVAVALRVTKVLRIPS